MRNTLRTAALTDRPNWSRNNLSALRRRRLQQSSNHVAAVFSTDGLAQLSGLSRLHAIDITDDSVIQMMVKLQLDRDDEQRSAALLAQGQAKEDSNNNNQRYIPEYEVEDDDEEATTTANAGTMSKFFARQSWPFTRKTVKSGKDLAVATDGLGLTPVTEIDSEEQAMPVFRARMPQDESSRKSSQQQDEEAVIPEDHREKLDVLAKRMKDEMMTPEELKSASVEDTIDKFIVSQVLSLNTLVHDRGTSSRLQETSINSERGRKRSDGSKSVSTVASTQASSGSKHRVNPPHIVSPWAEEFEFVNGSRFVESLMDEEKSPNEKVSIWTKLPKLSRKRSASRKRAEYVATRIPGAAQ